MRARSIVAILCCISENGASRLFSAWWRDPIMSLKWVKVLDTQRISNTDDNLPTVSVSCSSYRSAPHLQSRGRDKLERPLQLPQASPQLLPNCRPLRPCCPSQLVKEWTVLEDVAQSAQLDHTGSRGWERSSASGTCAVSACSVRFLRGTSFLTEHTRDPSVYRPCSCGRRDPSVYI